MQNFGIGLAFELLFVFLSVLLAGAALEGAAEGVGDELEVVASSEVELVEFLCLDDNIVDVFVVDGRLFFQRGRQFPVAIECLPLSFSHAFNFDEVVVGFGVGFGFTFCSAVERQVW